MTMSQRNQKNKHKGTLLVVGGARMPAFNVLVVERVGRVAVLQLGNKLARMAGVHAIISSRCRHQQSRVPVAKKNHKGLRVATPSRLVRALTWTHPPQCCDRANSFSEMPIPLACRDRHIRPANVFKKPKKNTQK
jgi:hypothetical protein